MDITIHLGMHKTGSSFLQSHFFSMYKNESGYFSLRDYAREFLHYILYCGESFWCVERARELFESSLKRARFVGDKLTIVEEMLCGDPYMNAFNRRQVFERLNLVFPLAKYVLVLREQEGMTQTLYLQYIKLGGSCSWKDFLTSKQPPLLFSWGEYLNYAPYVSDIYNAVGRDRFLCMPYEMMLEDRSAFLCRLASFIGFELGQAQSIRTSKRVNPSLSPRPAIVLSVMNKLCKSYRQPYLLLPRFVQVLSRKAMLRISSARKNAIPDEVVSEFCVDSKMRNNELTPIVGLDVSKYGY